jgi:hypothetical protein
MSKSKIYLGDLVYLDTRYGNKISTSIVGDWIWGWTDGSEVKGVIHDERAILVFLEEMLYRYNNELPTIIMNDGDERTGKSTFSILCNRIYKSPAFQDRARYKKIISNPDFTLDEFLECSPLDLKDICFEKKDLQEQMRTRKMADMTWLIEDEAGHQLFAQEWWDKVQMSLVKNLQVTAKKRQIIQLNLPHFLDLTGKIRGRAAKMYCHAEMLEESNCPTVQRGFMEIRRAVRQRWKQEIYWEPFYAFKFRQLKDKDWDEYNKLKDAFIQLVDEEKADGGDINEERLAAICSRAVKDKNYTMTELGRIVGVNHSTISRIITKYSEKPKVNTGIES